MNEVYVLCTHVEITSLTRHILEIMVSKFSNIMININKVIGNRSTFFSGGVTLERSLDLVDLQCLNFLKDLIHGKI
jgi:uncharacterized protein involved in tellurium resistance